MIRGAVALQADNAIARLIQVNDANIDPILRHSHLGMCIIACSLERCQEPALEIAIGLLPGLAAMLETANGRIFQKLLENTHAALLSVSHDLRMVEGSE